MKTRSTKRAEHWRPVVGFEERYEVSDKGRVRSRDMEVGAKGGSTAVRKGRLLAPSYCAFGYVKFTLCEGKTRQQKNAHVLVLEAFVGPRPGAYPAVHARHKNGRKADNRATNLTWGSALQNNHDKLNHGTMLRGSQVGTSKLTEAQVRTILKKREPAATAAARYGVSENHIYSVRSGRCWKHMQGAK